MVLLLITILENVVMFAHIELNQQLFKELDWTAVLLVLIVVMLCLQDSKQKH